MIPKIGSVVLSIAGHDSDVFMVIISIDGDFAFISDGKERKLSKPKKKRLKHLRITNTVVNIDNLTDKALRAILSDFVRDNSQNAET